jgi:hypothetical protein
MGNKTVFNYVILASNTKFNATNQKINVNTFFWSTPAGVGSATDVDYVLYIKRCTAHSERCTCRRWCCAFCTVLVKSPSCYIYSGQNDLFYKGWWQYITSLHIYSIISNNVQFLFTHSFSFLILFDCQTYPRTNFLFFIKTKILYVACHIKIWTKAKNVTNII